MSFATRNWKPLSLTASHSRDQEMEELTTTATPAANKNTHDDASISSKKKEAIAVANSTSGSHHDISEINLDFDEDDSESKLVASNKSNRNHNEDEDGVEISLSQSKVALSPQLQQKLAAEEAEEEAVAAEEKYHDALLETADANDRKDDEQEEFHDTSEYEVTLPTTTFEKKAVQEFSRSDFQVRNPLPVIVEGLSVKPKNSKANASRQQDHDPNALQTAPNFASALLGRTVAGWLRLSNPPPQQLSPNRTNREDGEIVSNITCLMLPGESTLVLGPSSSGKTTLMQAISQKIRGQPMPKAIVEGSVLVGSEDPTSSHKNSKRRTAFADQGDLSLTPVLTVQETVTFARACAEGDYDFMPASTMNILKLTGLDHVATTVVGDADLRGVSGGQKRRVKVLEQAVGKDCAVMFLDEMTNGLDAASALSLSQVLRLSLQESKASAMTSLLQPSNEVFQEYHRLILLTSDGKLAFSGKQQLALDYFQNHLGLMKPDNMNIPEFLLQAIYDPHSFQHVEAPMKLATSEDWSTAFQDSPAFQQLQNEIERVKSQQYEELSDLPPFATSVCAQMKALLGRAWKLVLRNPASVLRLVLAIFFGAFIGTLFLDTPSDDVGTHRRAGYVLTLLFMGFLNSSMSPLEDLFKDRNTYYIHRRSQFYRTGTYYVSNLLATTPVPLLEMAILAVISFFCVGMNNQSGWGFLYFLLMFLLTSMNGAAMARILAYSLPSEDVAQVLGPAVLLLVVLATGLSPQYMQLPVWLRWLSWISPTAYCYEGVMVGELYGRTVQISNNARVDGKLWAKENLGLPRLPYRNEGANDEMRLMVFDAVMLVVWCIALEIIGCFFLHASQKWYGPATKRYQVAAGMSLSTPPAWMEQTVRTNNNKLAVKNGKSSVGSGTIPKAPAAHLTAVNIVYEVDVPIVEEDTKSKSSAQQSSASSMVAGSKAPFGSVSARARDDERGPDITSAQYGQIGKGALQEKWIKQRLGEDAVNSSDSSQLLSTRTTIRTELAPAAPGRLRLLSKISASFNPGTLTALMGSSGAGKTTLLDCLAGYKTGGHLSGEISINGVAKTESTWKSLAAYCEQTDLHSEALTVRESLIFAARMRLRPFTLQDDTKVAFAERVLNLLELEEFADMMVGDEARGEGLPKHARKRLTVGVELAANPSILFADEPTSGLDSLSASLVVSCLQRAARQEGLTVVCTIHQPSRSVFEAFDNLLLLKKGGVCVYNGAISLIDSYIRSGPQNGDKYAMESDANPADHVLDIFCGPGGEGVDWPTLYENSDMAVAVKRGHEEDAKAMGGIEADTSQQSFLSELFVEVQRELLIFWRTPTYTAVRFYWTVGANLIVGFMYLNADLVNLLGALFFYVNIATVPMLSSIVPLMKSRAVFYREIASGTYRHLVYGIAVQVAEIPFNLVSALISFVIFYFMVGFSTNLDQVGYFMLMAFASYWLLPACGQLLAFISPNMGVAVLIGSLMLSLFTQTMGFLIPPDAIPNYWVWIYWINPLRYILQGLLVNEVGINNPEGEALIDQFGWTYNDRWWYCYGAVILFAVAVFVGTLFATKISWLKR